MTYMEIATYLGMVSEMLRKANENEEDKDCIEMTNILREAVMQAQLAMYEMARTEIRRAKE